MSAFKLGRGDASSKASPGAILSGLKFSDQTKPTKQAEQSRSPRAVVLEFLRDQVELAKGDMVGKEYTVARTRFSKDDDGRSIKKTVNVVPRRAYWQDSDNNWLGSVRYGNVVIEIGGAGMTSFIGGSKIGDLVTIYETIRRAVEAGELDGAIAAAAEKARRHKGVAKAA